MNDRVEDAAFECDEELSENFDVNQKENPAETGNNKFAFVFWTKTCQWSVVLSENILEKDMFIDPKKIGHIKYGSDQFLGRCLATGGNILRIEL